MKKITPWHYWAPLLLICSNYLRTVMHSVSAYFLFLALLGSATNSLGEVLPQVAWTFAANGPVYSSPALGKDGTIYFCTHLSTTLYALNPNGTLKWQVTGGRFNSSPVITSDNTILVSANDNELNAISADGEFLWKNESRNNWGSVPAVSFDGSIYFPDTGGNVLHAYFKDRTPKWKYYAAGVIGLAAIDSEGVIYLGAEGPGLIAIDSLGLEKWRLSGSMGISSIGFEDMIYASSGGDINAINPMGETAWVFHTGANIWGSSAIDLSGTIYVGSENNNLYAIRSDGIKKWEYATKGNIEATPAIGQDGTIFVGSYDGTFYALNSDGTRKWSYTTRDTIRSSAVINDQGLVIFGSNDGKLYALQAGTKLAIASWPMALGNPQHTASAARGPAIFQNPESTNALLGANVVLTVGTYGAPKPAFIWFKDGVLLVNMTNQSLTLANVQLHQAGEYRVAINNIAGAVTSQVATLTVNLPVTITQQPASQSIINGTTADFTVEAAGTLPLSYQWYKNAVAIPTATNSYFSIRSANFSDGGIYTVIVSNPYDSKTSQAATLTVKAVPNIVLNDLTLGGGIVMPEPFQSSFAPNSFITVTAEPADGWTFLDWKENIQGTNPVATIQVTYAKTLRARFGTPITVTPYGNGTVRLIPSSKFYSYGTSVRMVAEPQPGNYFAGWSGSADGDGNPLTMMVYDANPAVYASFDVLPVGRVALTLIPDGYGGVSVMPRDNTYTIGQTVTNKATPDDGQEFLGWSGDATGTNNPLIVTMNQSKVITAKFTKRPRLDIQPLNLDGLLLALTGEFSGSYCILTSTNLVDWVPYLTLTNAYGEAQINEPPPTNQWRFYQAVEVDTNAPPVTNNPPIFIH